MSLADQRWPAAEGASGKRKHLVSQSWVGDEAVSNEHDRGVLTLLADECESTRPGEGSGLGRPDISGSLKQALSFGCRLLRLRCCTCVVVPHLAWP
jgi:hypothetical protein